MAAVRELVSRRTRPVTHTVACVVVENIRVRALTTAFTVATTVVEDKVSSTRNISPALTPAFSFVIHLISWTSVAIVRTLTLTCIRIESLRWPTLLHPGTFALAGPFVKDLVLWTGVPLMANTAARLAVKVPRRRASVRRTLASACLRIESFRRLASRSRATFTSARLTVENLILVA